jgi:hypothetical protein
VSHITQREGRSTLCDYVIQCQVHYFIYTPLDESYFVVVWQYTASLADGRRVVMLVRSNRNCRPLCFLLQSQSSTMKLISITSRTWKPNPPIPVAQASMSPCMHPPNEKHFRPAFEAGWPRRLIPFRYLPARVSHTPQVDHHNTVREFHLGHHPQHFASCFLPTTPLFPIYAIMRI